MSQASVGEDRADSTDETCRSRRLTDAGVPSGSSHTPASDDEHERRSRLLRPHEGSSLGRLAPRGAGWRLTKRGSGPTTF